MNGYNDTMDSFLRKLTHQLATPLILHRMQQQRTPRDSKLCANLIGFNMVVPPMEENVVHNPVMPIIVGSRADQNVTFAPNTVVQCTEEL